VGYIKIQAVGSLVVGETRSEATYVFGGKSRPINQNEAALTELSFLE